MITEYIGKLERREFALALALASALIVIPLLVFALLPGQRQQSALQADLSTLKQSMQVRQISEADIALAEKSVADVGRKLHGDMANLPVKELEAHIIGRLQSVSWRNNIRLEAIQPGKGEVVDNFEEMRFSVSLTGRYFDLYRWLRDIDKELGFVLIKSYRMEPAGGRSGSELDAKLTLASYRSVQ